MTSFRAVGMNTSALNLRQTLPTRRGGAPPERKAGRTAGRRSTPAAGGGGDRPAAFGDSSTGEPGRIRPAVNAGLPDVERPTRACEEHGRPRARRRTDTG